MAPQYLAMTRWEKSIGGFAAKAKAAALGAAALALLALLAFNASGVMAAPSAQDSVNFTVSPTQLELAASPGSVSAQNITIANHSDEDLTLFLNVENLRSGSSFASARQWFEPDRTEVTVAPGEEERILLTMRIPEDAPPGGAFAAVFFQSSPFTEVEDSGSVSAASGVGVRVGATFFLTIKGDGLVLDAAVVGIVPVVLVDGSLGSRVIVENRGNMHFFPTGSVTLINSVGAVIGTVPLAESTSILPGEQKSLFTAVPFNVLDGDYSITATADYGWQDWQIEAAGAVDEGPEENTSEGELSFNSEPKIRINQVELVTEPGALPTIVTTFENYGDVEVQPGGFLDVLNQDGERVIAVPIPAGSVVLEPHSSSLYEVQYTGLLPRGDYTVETVLGFGGTREIAEQDDFVVEEDIAPPTPSFPIPIPRATVDLRTPSSGNSTLFLGLAGAAGAVVLAAAGLIVLRRRGRSAPLPPPQTRRVDDQANGGDSATPEDAHEDPTAEGENPVAEHENAAAEEEDPATRDEDTGAENDDSVADDENSVAEDEDPIAEGEDPVADDENPVAEDEDPVAEDEDPAAEDGPDCLSEDSPEKHDG